MSSLHRATAMLERFGRALRMIGGASARRARPSTRDVAEAVSGKGADNNDAISTWISSASAAGKIAELRKALNGADWTAYPDGRVQSERGADTQFRANEARNAEGAVSRRIPDVDHGAGRIAADNSARWTAWVTGGAPHPRLFGATGRAAARDNVMRRAASEAGRSTPGAQGAARLGRRTPASAMASAAPAVTHWAPRGFDSACGQFARAVRRFAASASGDGMWTRQSAALKTFRRSSDPTHRGIQRPGDRAARFVRKAAVAVRRVGASMPEFAQAATRAAGGGAAPGAVSGTTGGSLAAALRLSKRSDAAAQSIERAAARAQAARSGAAVGAAAAARAVAFPGPPAAGGRGMPPVHRLSSAGAFARNTQTPPIIINYAPDLAIHADAPADGADLRQRVLAVLERHARELYEALARETVRRQRMQFAAAAGAGL